MALFSRRRLQSLIEETATILSDSQMREFVRRLNKIRADYLSVEWELALLAAFRKLGNVTYEPSLGGLRKPDILYSTEDSGVTFAADIVAISDRSLQQRNPVNKLQERLAAEITAANIESGNFLIQVGDTLPRRGLWLRSTPVRLKLPLAEDLDEVIFNRNFRDFLQQISRSPNNAANYVVSDERRNVDLQIAYRPGSRRSTQATYITYTSATRIDRNPLYNALKEKADQLKKTGFAGIKGIIVCDGGCRILQRSSHSWNEFSVGEIIAEFFRRHSSVSFVLTIAIKPKPSMRGFDERSVFAEFKVYVSPKASETGSVIKALLSRLPAYFPQIEGTPENVVNQIRYVRRGAFYGGALITPKSVRISATTLLQLLAGKMSQTEFLNQYRSFRFNPFLQHLNRGELLSKVEIRHTPEDDDDWVEFTFGKQDAAVSEFKVPSNKVADKTS